MNNFKNENWKRRVSIETDRRLFLFFVSLLFVTAIPSSLLYKTEVMNQLIGFMTPYIPALYYNTIGNQHPLETNTMWVINLILCPVLFLIYRKLVPRSIQPSSENVIPITNGSAFIFLVLIFLGPNYDPLWNSPFIDNNKHIGIINRIFVSNLFITYLITTFIFTAFYAITSLAMDYYTKNFYPTKSMGSE